MANVSIAGSVIERLGRAICAQLSVITGDRSVGHAIVRPTAGAVTLPPNAYAIPIDGVAFEQQPVKVAHNPLTVREHMQGGEWTIAPGGTLVTFKSNVGGARNNWRPGTELRFVPTIEGIEELAVVDSDGFTGGTIGPVQQVVVYDDFPSADISKATFQGRVDAMPALVLAWMSSTPVEGRTAGLSQGGTRKQRGVRAYFENFVLYTLAKEANSGETRRKVALQVTEAARSLLGDHKVNIDGEILSGMATGLEIIDSRRMPKKEQALPMMTTFRVISVRKRIDARAFNDWNWTRYKAFEQADEDNDEELVRNNAKDPMP